MGGKNSDPDYRGAALAQGEANREVVRDQTFANRPDQYTPFGSTTWNPYQTLDPATGENTTAWEQVQSLDPRLQAILDKQIAVQGGRTDIAGMLTGRMGGEFGQQMDWRGLNPMGQVPTQQYTMPEPDAGNPYETRQRAEDAVYNQAQSRLAPRFAEQRKQQEIRLRNQGLRPGDQAWQSQMGAIDQQETDAYNQAQYSAVGAGREEAGQMYGQQMGRQSQNFQQALGANRQNFGQAMQGSQYANQIRQQQITEAMQKRGFSLNEINALLSGQQINAPQMPNFSQAAAAQAAPIYQGTVDAGNFSQAQTQQMIDGVTGMAGMGMAMSDRRLKSNIKKIGTRGGHNWYSYDIFGLPSEGVMADEIPAEFTVDVGGYKAVDYDKLGV